MPTNVHKERQDKNTSDSTNLGPTQPNSHDSINSLHSWWTDPRTTDLSYFSQLSLAKDLNDFKQRILKVVNQMGFSDFSFVHMNASGDIDSLVLTTIPKAISESYFEQGLYEHDLIIPYANSRTRPIFRSELENYVNQAPFENDMTRTSSEIYKLNKSHGFYEFFNMPSDSYDGSGKVMFLVTQREGNPFEFRQRVIQSLRPLELLSEAIDMIVGQRFSNVIGLKKLPAKTVYKINPAPLRVLQTLANNDLTIQCIADKLFISAVTANKHLETARKSLGVRTNYAAIKKGLESGLIHFE